MADSGVPRANIFLLTKTGSGKALGYNDSMAQFNALLAAGGYTYVDAVLVHWPTASAPSVEPSCATGAPTYDAKACRLATWRAYVDIFNSGRALSIGVSNYNSTHLQEIKDAGMPLPALNQIPYNLYRSSSWEQTVAWCRDNGVVVNAYSPFGVPDVQRYPAAGGMSPLLLEDPVLTSIAAAHGRTPAALELARETLAEPGLADVVRAEQEAAYRRVAAAVVDALGRGGPRGAVVRSKGFAGLAVDGGVGEVALWSHAGRG
jgi:2,5-diketo-D-gluconate reductase A